MRHFKLIIVSSLFIVAIFPSCKEGQQKSLNFKNPAVPKIEEETISKSCGEVVLDIVRTSDRYKQITKGLYEAVIKNGGSSYGITFESSPNPKLDNSLQYSKTYDFSLHETYPDHSPVIARFTFDKVSRQLYENLIAEDSSVSISFDRKLLVKLDAKCN